MMRLAIDQAHHAWAVGEVPVGAVIVRDGGEYFIEDLGSSNGTWFNKQRIKRRKVEDGDEYFICSEKVKFVYR